MRILNLYAGIGGNRKLWGNNHEIVAIENNENIAKIYHDLYPNDTVIVTDAHQYLLEHFNEFDFIWASPPCPSHSRRRKTNPKVKPIYPDMKLYEEIILLQHYFKGKFVVENVIGYYEPLIKPIKLQRHYFWTNFNVPDKKFVRENVGTVKDRERLSKLYDINIDKYTGVDKRLCLRNCVLPELGKYIFDCMLMEED